MSPLEKELNIVLPPSIARIVDGLPFQIDSIGRSESRVVMFEDYVLKVSSLSFDIENEWKNYRALKGKLPIAEILAHEVVDGRIFLLKKKLKGKMLCDDYYMSRPTLLYSLAKKALEALWAVDIKGLDLQDSFATILAFGKGASAKGYLHFENADPSAVAGFSSYAEIFAYLEANKPSGDPVLSHGDLCLTNIICEEDHLVGFIDTGLLGISERYHDLAILYRSTKYNFSGIYGKAYPGFDEDAFFRCLGIKKKPKLIRYYLLLDEVLG